ncbi:MAG: hypothetical protein V1766_01705 [Pseudomonadota bacterium]
MANYHLKARDDALKDWLIYEKAVQSAIVCDIIVICYYKTKRYTKSIDYFKRYFQMQKDGEPKDYEAYNIGCLDALLGNIDEAINWLEIPLDRKKWLDLINADEDFKAMRKNKGD